MKLAWKTFLAFSFVTLIFAVSLGTLFGQLFRQNTLAVFKSTLEKRAVELAASFAELDVSRTPDMMPRGHGTGPFQQKRQNRQLTDYLNFLRAHSSEDIWLIDDTKNVLVTPSSGKMGHMGSEPFRLEEKELPENAISVVNRALAGETVLTEYFSDTLGITAITAGTPLKIDQDTSGVLLLHAPIAGMAETNRRAFGIFLISAAVGLLLSAIASIFFSRRLTRPLQKMQTYAKTLATGDYEKRLSVGGNDELADLGRSLDTLGQKLSAAVTNANRSLQARQDFLATISHELRTPVTVLRGLVEAIQDGIIADDEETRQQMLAETTQLDRLIFDLLELSRLEQNDFVLEVKPQSLNQVLADAVRSMGPLATKRRIRLRLKKNEPDSPFDGDYGRLKQMFVAVLDNALRVSPEGGQVDIIYDQKKISITDEGPGIPPEVLPHLFERYYQGKDQGSSGLGLTISQAIAKKHGIRIEVNSEPGCTAFMFFLP